MWLCNSHLRPITVEDAAARLSAINIHIYVYLYTIYLPLGFAVKGEKRTYSYYAYRAHSNNFASRINHELTSRKTQTDKRKLTRPQKSVNSEPGRISWGGDLRRGYRWGPESGTISWEGSCGEDTGGGLSLAYRLIANSY